jgi:hypothetical protein
VGFNISWLAVRGKSPSQVCSELNLEKTDEQSPFPESEVASVELDSGWYLVHFNQPDSIVLSDNSIKNLSKKAEVVTCAVSEVVMISMASSFVDGMFKWSVVHDSNEGLEHIEEKGNLPEHYQDIKNRLFEQLQADPDSCDYVFDLPIELAKSLTTFRHDDVREDEDSNPFTIMERNDIESSATSSTATKPWWQFW